MNLPKPFNHIERKWNKENDITAVIWPSGTASFNLFYKYKQYANSDVDTIYFCDANRSGEVLHRLFEKWAKEDKRKNVIIPSFFFYSYNLPDYIGRYFDEVVESDDLEEYFPISIKYNRKNGKEPIKNPGVSFVIEDRGKLIKVKPKNLDLPSYLGEFDISKEEPRTVCAIMENEELEMLPVVNLEDARDVAMTIMYGKETHDYKSLEEILYGTSRKLADIAYRENENFVATYNFHDFVAGLYRNDRVKRFYQNLGGKEETIEWFERTAKKYFNEVVRTKIRDSPFYPLEVIKPKIRPYLVCGLISETPPPYLRKVPVILMSDSQFYRVSKML